MPRCVCAGWRPSISKPSIRLLPCGPSIKRSTNALSNIARFADRAPYPLLIKPITLMTANYREVSDYVYRRYPFFRSTYFERRMLFERAGPLCASFNRADARCRATAGAFDSPNASYDGGQLLLFAGKRANYRLRVGAHRPPNRSPGGAISVTRSRTSFLLDSGASFISRGCEPLGAGIDRLAVELDHAFLAGVGVDAGEADGEARVAVGPDPTQAVEHRLARLEWHLIAFPAARRRPRCRARP